MSERIERGGHIGDQDIESSVFPRLPVGPGPGMAAVTADNYGHEPHCRLFHLLNMPGGSPCPPPPRPLGDGWFREYENGAEYVDHLGGVDWCEAPLPRRWHRCRAQTRGFMSGRLVYRCACGATGFSDGIWIHRNERRRP